MAMQPKTWMTSFLFSKWMSQFIACVQSKDANMSYMNRHPLIMDGHNLHDTKDIMLQVCHVGLYLVTLPSRTSHALQLLDVACFKPSQRYSKHLVFGQQE